VKTLFRAGGLRWAFLLLAAVVLMLTMVSSAAADQTYTDPQGDGKVGTDVASIVVKNDAAGNILIDVTSVNPVVANHAIAIFIDADRNTSTGSSFGDDFWFYGGPAVGVAFFAWNGSQFAPTSPGSFSAGQVGTNTSEFRINKADLGNTSAFNFVAISISIDPPNVNFWDSAPDTGEYTYTLTAPAPPPAPAPAPTPTPKPAPQVPATVGLAAVSVKTLGGVHAGRIFTVAARVTTTARTVRVRCVIKVAGRAVPALGRYAAHVASCQGIAPAGTVGKRLAGTMTVTIAGDHDTRAFSFVIRK
jgi:hypothetical protein